MAYAPRLQNALCLLLHAATWNLSARSGMLGGEQVAYSTVKAILKAPSLYLEAEDPYLDCHALSGHTFSSCVVVTD